ncbi:MAG: 4-alpha-glucanotransferase, partial [Nitrospirae bacterium]
ALYLSEYDEYIKELMLRERVNFAPVRELKLDILRILFYEDYDERDFKNFMEANRYWLDDYAIYNALKAAHNRAAWYDWEEEYRDRNSPHVEVFANKHRGEIRFYKFVQWILYKQLLEVKSYAKQNGVLIMGDLPILASKDSADVWSYRQYFKTQYSAGAPPDMYSATGQKWGLPPYNWEALRADDFIWWKKRLEYAQHFYDIFRLDHIIGFFRIYTIAEDAQDATSGFYEPEDEKEWRKQGEALLSMIIDSTDMLVVGEDLGTVPKCCREVMREFGIPGLKIERWERYYDGDGSFIDPSAYDPISVASLSTHDSETLMGWWHKFPEDRALYYKTIGYSGEPPEEMGTDIFMVCLSRIYNASSIFVILGLWDILAIVPGVLKEDHEENRVNVPATVNEKNWTLRFNFYLEEVFGERFSDFNNTIRRLIEESGRASINKA